MVCGQSVLSQTVKEVGEWLVQGQGRVPGEVLGGFVVDMGREIV